MSDGNWRKSHHLAQLLPLLLHPLRIRLRRRIVMNGVSQLTRQSDDGEIGRR